MAKNDKKAPINYKVELRTLKERGPEPLYLLWGQEDYLREHYFTALKQLCLPDGEDDFSLKRIDGPEMDANTLRQAVDAMPFMTERTLVEVRGVDINKLSEPDEFISVLSDIPDFCTVVFIQSAGYEPDGRLKFVKLLRKSGREIEFTPQSQYELKDWIQRRFAAAGKEIDTEAVERLILVSGDRMNALVPEIEKIAGYVSVKRVSIKDVDAIADHIPAAIIFDITGLIAQREYDRAAVLLRELLDNKKNEPIAMLAAIGYQMRQLYAARLAIEEGLGTRFLLDCGMVKLDFIANKLISQAKGFSIDQLEKAVELCAEMDYSMKSSSANDAILFKELFMRIAAGENNA